MFGTTVLRARQRGTHHGRQGPGPGARQLASTVPTARRSATTIEPTPEMSTFAIVMSGEMDIAAELYLELVLHRFRGAGHPNAVVDLVHVTFLDARGLRFLQQVAELSRERGGQVSLLRPSAGVLNILQEAKVDTLFTVKGAQGDPAPRIAAVASPAFVARDQ